MEKSYPFKFIDHLLQTYNLASEKELINALNNHHEIKVELLDYLVTIRQFKIVESFDDGIFCIKHNAASGESTYKYQENGKIYDKNIFKSYGECLIYAERTSKNPYYNPFLSHVIEKYSLKNQDDFVFLLKNDDYLKKDIINHLHKVKHIYTELKTYDGDYCLSNYPTKGFYSFVNQERGIIYPGYVKFPSQEECLVYALIGDNELNCWRHNKKH